ncbi:hypothetical protein [Exiguobacterium undae]
MNFLKRAGKSIMARKGKTLILLIILSVIGSLVLSGFAIQHAAKSAGEEARKELGATVTLQVDRQKQMQERQGSGERGRPEQQAISLEEIESIAKLSKVKSVNYVSQTTATSSSVDPVTSEATGALDEKTAADIIQLFQRLAHESNRCVITVTHSAEVARAANHIIELKQQRFQMRTNLHPQTVSH